MPNRRTKRETFMEGMKRRDRTITRLIKVLYSLLAILIIQRIAIGLGYL